MKISTNFSGKFSHMEKAGVLLILAEILYK